MTNRLTSYTRALIVRKLMVHKFTETLKELRHSMVVIADCTYDRAFKRSDHLQMAALNIGWLPESGYFQAQFGATISQICFSGELILPYRSDEQKRIIAYIDYANDTEKTEVKRRFPHSKNNGVLVVITADSDLAIMFHKYEENLKTFLADIIAAENAAYGIVKRATTITKLIELWPEIEPFTKGLGAPEERLMPVIQTTELNKTFGLPVK